MGLTTLIVEIITILFYQTVYGFFYFKISLLLASFMIGLFGGAIVGRKMKIFFGHMIQIQAGLVVAIIIFSYFIQYRPAENLFFLFLFSLGLLNGLLFIVSNKLYCRDKRNLGLGYGLDLLGSFVGAIATSAFLIPLLGFSHLIKYILLLNSFCLIFIFWGFKKGVQ